LVYLIHFERPYRHARHYLGFVDGDEEALDRRLARHRAGTGARLIDVIQRAGIGWELARTWPDATRVDERKMKKSSHASKRCPVCRRLDKARDGAI
jgi:hypothetical protein